MKNNQYVSVEMSRAAYNFYKENWREGKVNKKGEQDGFCKEALIAYLNKTGHYLGEVVDIAITG